MNHFIPFIGFNSLPLLIASILFINDANAYDPDDLGSPQDRDMFFLQGKAPHDWIDRQKWAPGFNADSTSRLTLEYVSIPDRLDDSSHAMGKVFIAGQTTLGGRHWGAYMNVDRLSLQENQNVTRESDSRRLAAETGLWLTSFHGLFRGATLAYGGDWKYKQISELSRTGNFADIRESRNEENGWRGGSATLLLSPRAGQYLRAFASVSTTKMRADSGNSVTYDNPQFKPFNSSEFLTHSESSNHFRGEIGYLLSIQKGNLFDVHLRATLKDGHGLGNEALGDSSQFQLGLAWIRTFNRGSVDFQISPSANFAVTFSNPANVQQTYLGFLKPLDERNSQKVFSLRFPQRVSISLASNTILVYNYSVGLYASFDKQETTRKIKSSSTVDLAVHSGALTLFYGFTKESGIAFTPTGNVNSPGGKIQLTSNFP